jgi:hypothetical protein
MYDGISILYDNKGAAFSKKSKKRTLINVSVSRRLSLKQKGIFTLP